MDSKELEKIGHQWVSHAAWMRPLIMRGDDAGREEVAKEVIKMANVIRELTQRLSARITMQSHCTCQPKLIITTTTTQGHTL
tara:strand:- start:84 stop:329 length:246 start_codon:yes stop_codon:yes gene_type:complete